MVLSEDTGLARAVRLGLLGFFWLVAWFLFGRTAAHGDTKLAWVVWAGAGTAVALNLVLLLFLLISPDFADLPPSELGVGWLMTFSALVAAFAATSFAASHSYGALPPTPKHGKPPAYVLDGSHHLLNDCYRDAGNRMTDGMSPWNAVYFALGTVTTAGSGELTAHSALCRKLTTAQLAFSFPMLGLAVAGVAVRLFRILSEPELEKWKTKRELRRAARRREREERQERRRAARARRREERRERRRAARARWRERLDRLRHGLAEAVRRFFETKPPGGGAPGEPRPAPERRAPELPSVPEASKRPETGNGQSEQPDAGPSEESSGAER